MSELRLNRKSFLKDLIIGASFAGKHKVIPILECVCITIRGNRVKIESNDNENSICIYTNNISSDSDVSFCVNASDLIRYVKSLSSEELSIVLSDDGKSITIKHEQGETILPTDSANEFPITKIGGEEPDLIVDASWLHNVVGDAKNYVGTNELYPMMFNLFLVKDGSKLDGYSGTHHTLMDYTTIYENELSDNYVEIPINKSCFSALMSLLGQTDKVKISKTDKEVYFSATNLHLSTRIIEGNRPRFEKVIPKDNHIRVIASKNKLNSALNRVALSCSQEDNLIVLSVSEDSIQITAEDLLFAKKSTERVDCTSNGKIKICLNQSLLLTCLNSVESDNVEMLFKDKMYPVLIQSADNADAVFVCMPFVYR